jgi:hypothetical protein
MIDRLSSWGWWRMLGCIAALPLSAVDMEHLTMPPVGRTLGRFELVRHLDYCGELLARIGKVTVLHAQATEDPVSGDN